MYTRGSNGNTANTFQVNAREAVAAGLLMDETSCAILTSMQADNRYVYFGACKPLSQLYNQRPDVFTALHSVDQHSSVLQLLSISYSIAHASLE